METQCTGEQLECHALGRRLVSGRFDGGRISSDAGSVLLREVDKRIGLTARVSRCLVDWRSVKYEDVSLRAYETPTELRAGLARYFGFYNTRRRHSALDRRTPDAVYFDQAHRDLAA